MQLRRSTHHIYVCRVAAIVCIIRTELLLCIMYSIIPVLCICVGSVIRKYVKFQNFLLQLVEIMIAVFT